MIESSSRRFIEAIDPHRDMIYARIVQVVPESQTEMVLQKAIRAAFKAYIQSGEKLQWDQAGIAEWIDDLVHRQTADSTEPQKQMFTSPPAMPADTWARLTAAVQIEAALLGGAAERSMLAYDPLLAPKKKSAGNDEQTEGLGLDPWTRFVFAAAIVLIFGIVITIVLMTHHTPLVPTSQSAATQAAATHATE